MAQSEAAEKLTDAIQAVAEAAREMSDNAEPTGLMRGGFYVSAGDMKALRRAIVGWSMAGTVLVRGAKETP